MREGGSARARGQRGGSAVGSRVLLGGCGGGGEGGSTTRPSPSQISRGVSRSHGGASSGARRTRAGTHQLRLHGRLRHGFALPFATAGSDASALVVRSGSRRDPRRGGDVERPLRVSCGGRASGGRASTRFSRAATRGGARRGCLRRVARRTAAEPWRARGCDSRAGGRGGVGLVLRAGRTHAKRGTNSHSFCTVVARVVTNRPSRQTVKSTAAPDPIEKIPLKRARRPEDPRARFAFSTDASGRSARVSSSSALLARAASRRSAPGVVLFAGWSVPRRARR